MPFGFLGLAHDISERISMETDGKQVVGTPRKKKGANIFLEQLENASSTMFYGDGDEQLRTPNHVDCIRRPGNVKHVETSSFGCLGNIESDQTCMEKIRIVVFATTRALQQLHEVRVIQFQLVSTF